jgi:hypothetical protein
VTIYTRPFALHDKVQHNISSPFLKGQTFKAHRLVLAACSTHFANLFNHTPVTAPLNNQLFVILDGTRADDLQILLHFMYRGEAYLHQDRINSVLRTAEVLQVKGLSEGPRNIEINQNLQQQGSSSASAPGRSWSPDARHPDASSPPPSHSRHLHKRKLDHHHLGGVGGGGHHHLDPRDESPLLRESASSSRGRHPQSPPPPLEGASAVPISPPGYGVGSYPSHSRQPFPMYRDHHSSSHGGHSSYSPPPGGGRPRSKSPPPPQRYKFSSASSPPPLHPKDVDSRSTPLTPSSSADIYEHHLARSSSRHSDQQPDQERDRVGGSRPPSNKTIDSSSGRERILTQSQPQVIKSFIFLNIAFSYKQLASFLRRSGWLSR